MGNQTGFLKPWYKGKSMQFRKLKKIRQLLIPFFFLDQHWKNYVKKYFYSSFWLPTKQIFRELSCPALFLNPHPQVRPLSFLIQFANQLPKIQHKLTHSFPAAISTTASSVWKVRSKTSRSSIWCWKHTMKTHWTFPKFARLLASVNLFPPARVAARQCDDVSCLTACAMSVRIKVSNTVYAALGISRELCSLNSKQQLSWHRGWPQSWLPILCRLPCRWLPVWPGSAQISLMLA